MKQAILFTTIIFFSLLCMCAQESSKIQITVGASSFVATLSDNVTARAFALLLPIIVTMKELNGNEKFHYLSGNLPASPARPSQIKAGDLMLYGENCVVLFYETFTTSYSYIKIGSIDNPAGLKTALSYGDPKVIFQINGNITGIENSESSKKNFLISKNGFLEYLGNEMKISLFDMNGKALTVWKSKIINVQNFQKGTYILKAEGENYSRTFKIQI